MKTLNETCSFEVKRFDKFIYLIEPNNNNVSQSASANKSVN